MSKHSYDMGARALNLAKRGELCFIDDGHSPSDQFEAHCMRHGMGSKHVAKGFVSGRNRSMCTCHRRP